MNPEKLKKLKSRVRIGGKGTPRRKKKAPRSVEAVNENKLRAAMKKLSLDSAGAVEEANIFNNDGTVIQFKKPSVQISTASNTVVIGGDAEKKYFIDLLPGILNEFGHVGAQQVQRLNETMANLLEELREEQGEHSSESSDEDEEDEEVSAEETEIQKKN